MKTQLVRTYQRLGFLQPIYRSVRQIYSIRHLKALVKRKYDNNEPLKVVIGANKKFQEGWVPTEIYNLNILKPEDWARYFRESSLDALIAEHVWEHLTPEQGKEAATLCLKYLKPGAYLRIAIPDGLFPSSAYIEYVRPGGSGPSAWDHKLLYTHRIATDIFSSVGFEVRLLEYWKDHGQFCETEWHDADGFVERSRKRARHFFPAQDGTELPYTSLLFDAFKPQR